MEFYGDPLEKSIKSYGAKYERFRINAILRYTRLYMYIYIYISRRRYFQFFLSKSIVLFLSFYQLSRYTLIQFSLDEMQRS